MGFTSRGRFFFCSHLPFDARNGTLFQSAHLRLGDADLRRCLHLRFALIKPHGQGIPIAAAYALFERRRFTTEQKALEYNHANARRSSGSLEPTAPDYYSPAEVRAMSQSEVRANYDKIMRSMQKWH